MTDTPIPLVNAAALASIDLDTCAEPTPEQIEQMQTGFGAIFPPSEALRLGMKTAIGNVRRALGAAAASAGKDAAG